jgi:hypothetical protein
LLKKKVKARGTDKGTESSKGESPPSWAPAHGYRRCHVYFPEHDLYVDHKKEVYISKDNDGWSITGEVPLRLGKIDLGKSVQIQVELDDLDDLQSLFDKHKIEFGIN